MKILVINGANLNMLGIREPNIYGGFSLDEINRSLLELAAILSVDLNFFQSNHEGDIIDKLHISMRLIDGIIINPGAFTHSSIAIRDAFLSVNIPFVEVHISNIFKREKFRHKSYLSDIAQGVISGLGGHSYICALRFLADFLSK